MEITPPDLLISLIWWTCLLYTNAKDNASFQILFKCPTPSFWEMLQNPHVLLTFDKVHNPLRLPRKTTSELPKVFRTPFFFVHFRLRTVLCATTACTFSTCELSKCSGAEMFCTFWLGNMLRATAACTFSTCQLPKVVWEWRALYIWLGNVLRVTMMCTFRHLNFQRCSEGEVLLAFSLANVLRATTACSFSSLIWPDCSAPRRFSEPTFRPSRVTNPWKNTVFRDFYLFARLHLVSSLLFPSLLFPSLLFSSLLTLSTSAFPSVHIFRSLTSKLSKLPSFNSKANQCWPAVATKNGIMMSLPRSAAQRPSPGSFLLKIRPSRLKQNLHPM